MYKDDWFDYDYDEFVINKYPRHNYICTLSSGHVIGEALTTQANAICSDMDPVVFISGGIDSQAAAYGFAFSHYKKRVKFVHIQPSFDGFYNENEWFYVREFCKRFSLPLEIVHLEFDLKTLRQFLFNTEFFDVPTGTGTIFLLEGIRRWKKKHGGVPVTADGHFVFTRERNTCKGQFKKPGLTLSEGIKLEEMVLFDYYDTHMLEFYESTHRLTRELQFLKRMEAKTLFYTQMGFNLRPKLSGWEFLDRKHDYSALSTIDWSNDHSKHARYDRGVNVIADLLGFPESYVERKLALQKDDKDRFVTLYEFDSEVF